MNYNTCMRPIIDHNSQTIHISMLGRQWQIERPASLEELWNMLAEDLPGTEPEEPEDSDPLGGGIKIEISAEGKEESPKTEAPEGKATPEAPPPQKGGAERRKGKGRRPGKKKS